MTVLVRSNKQTRIEGLRRRLEKIQKKDQQIMIASQLAAEFGDLEEPPQWVDEGGVKRLLTKRERQIARDARQPKKSAPIYLEMAQRRFDAISKIEQAKPTIQINAHAIQFVMGSKESTSKYEEIEVTKEEDK